MSGLLTYVVALPEGYYASQGEFGKLLDEAMNALDSTGRPAQMTFTRILGEGDFKHVDRRWAGWVIGRGLKESPQVYVVVEGQGAQVTETTGDQTAVDALVDVLRKRGYTCMKRGG